jgi:hypothetical protein
MNLLQVTVTFIMAAAARVVLIADIYSLPRLQFRDHIWAYNQRYLAIEAMEEATTAMMGGEEHRDEEEGSGDEIKLVQQLVFCAEAVACRDKVHASILLSELRANALVFGTSFQRVASCFVQGLSDRLALIQPLGVNRPHGKNNGCYVREG